MHALANLDTPETGKIVLVQSKFSEAFRLLLTVMMIICLIVFLMLFFAL